MDMESIIRLFSFLVAGGLSIMFFYIPLKRIPLSRESLRWLVYTLGAFFAFFAVFTLVQDPRILLFSPRVADTILLLGVTVFGLTMIVAFLNDQIVEYMVTRPLKIARLKESHLIALRDQLTNHPDQPHNKTGDRV